MNHVAVPKRLSFLVCKYLCISAQRNFNLCKLIRDGPLKKKFMQGKVAKKIMQRSKEKKFVQSELHHQADKLYLP